MAFITAIKLGKGETEEHIILCSILYPEWGKSFNLPPKVIAGYIDNGEVVQVATLEGPVEVISVHRTGADDYIRTKADGKLTNNLLGLPYIR